MLALLRPGSAAGAFGLRTRWGRGCRRRGLCELGDRHAGAFVEDVAAFAVLSDVEAEFFFVFGDPQTQRKVQHFEYDGRHCEGVHPNRGNRGELIKDLCGVTVEQPLVVREPANGGGCEEAGCERAPRAAYSMYGDNVQRVIDARAFT